MGLIQDVYPPTQTVKDAMKQVDSNFLLHVETEAIITELYCRGVTIQDIFAQYYAMEEMGNALNDQIFGSDEAGLHGNQVMTVADAQLITPEPKPKRPLGG